jgi:hypothetical protein
LYLKASERPPASAFPAVDKRPSAALLLGCHPQRTNVYASGVILRSALHLGTSERPPACASPAVDKRSSASLSTPENGLSGRDFPASAANFQKKKNFLFPYIVCEPAYIGVIESIATISCVRRLFVKAKARKQIIKAKKSFKNMKDFFSLSRKST